MQETWVQSLVQEDPTCLRAAKPVHRNYWACMCSRAGELPLRSPDASATEVCTPQSPCSAPREATTTRSPHTTIRDWPCSRQLERSVPSSEDSAQPKWITREKNKENLSKSRTQLGTLLPVAHTPRRNVIIKRWRNNILLVLARFGSRFKNSWKLFYSV